MTTPPWCREKVMVYLFIFMDLEKAYVSIDLHGMWQLLKAVQSFHVGSRACVWVVIDVSE